MADFPLYLAERVITCIHVLSHIYSIHTRNEVGWDFCMIDGYLILVHTFSVDLSASRCKQVFHSTV